MLRFPNPGSTIQNFVAVYGAAQKELNTQTVTLDQVTNAIVKANLATSSGFVGDEAIARSTRKDRSRDPLYNQSKMYAELFRSMGWLHPTDDRSLNFTFTLLGEQVVAAHRFWQPLFQECVIGIVYPSRVLDVKGDYDLRPFATILRVMRRVGNRISRDEMIIGPLSAKSDRTPDAITTLTRKIEAARKSPAALNKALSSLATERGIQINTLHNYTRWPIAVLRDTKWADDTAAKFATGQSYKAFQLTAEGIALADLLEGAADIRLDHLDRLSAAEKAALCFHAHYAMLERAGFDLSPVRAKLEEHTAALGACLSTLSIPPNARLVFSPYQTLAPADLRQIFAIEATASVRQIPSVSKVGHVVVGRNPRDHLFVVPHFQPVAAGPPPSRGQHTRDELAAISAKASSLEMAAAAFAKAHAGDTRDVFYPLVADLFDIAGYRSETSRAGVNYQRWDACVWIADMQIPVEIKSPTEERELSTKSVRQALENKIISIARGGLAARKDITSLIVGFSIPTERSDMAQLIEDIHVAYGFPIGVVSITTLAKLALVAMTTKQVVDAEQLILLKGFLDG